MVLIDPSSRTYIIMSISSIDTPLHHQLQSFSHSKLRTTQTKVTHLNSLYAPSVPTFGLTQAPTIYDTPIILSSKLDKLAKLIEQSTKVVVLTGAGISTSADIPDYRSPKGTHHTSLFDFEMVKRAQPTAAHMVLASMAENNKITHVITGNHDGLHQKAGMSDEVVVELHGNFFIERCTKCGHVYHREEVVQAKSGHLTLNTCTQVYSFYCHMMGFCYCCWVVLLLGCWEVLLLGCWEVLLLGC